MDMSFFNQDFTFTISQVGCGLAALTLIVTLAYQTGYNRARQVEQQEAVKAGVAKWQTVDHSPRTTFVYSSIARDGLDNKDN